MRTGVILAVLALHGAVGAVLADRPTLVREAANTGVALQVRLDVAVRTTPDAPSVRMSTLPAAAGRGTREEARSAGRDAASRMPASPAPAHGAVSAAPAPHLHEPWELDAPVGFAFAPVGLEGALERLQGPVLLRVSLAVDETGRLIGVAFETAIGVDEDLRAALAEAFHAAAYEPGRLGGRAVAAFKRLELRQGIEAEMGLAAR